MTSETFVDAHLSLLARLYELEAQIGALPPRDMEKVLEIYVAYQELLDRATTALRNADLAVARCYADTSHYHERKAELRVLLTHERLLCGLRHSIEGRIAATRTLQRDLAKELRPPQ
jgi:hypothetical protein